MVICFACRVVRVARTTAIVVIVVQPIKSTWTLSPMLEMWTLNLSQVNYDPWKYTRFFACLQRLLLFWLLFFSYICVFANVAVKSAFLIADTLIGIFVIVIFEFMIIKSALHTSDNNSIMSTCNWENLISCDLFSFFSFVLLSEGTLCVYL